MKGETLEKLHKKHIFSIEGNIGSGKSTIIQHLQKIYKGKVLLVEEPVEQWQNIENQNLLAKKNEDLCRWGYTFESYVLITKMNELVKAAESESDIILIERCMLTDKVFFDVNVKNGKVDPMEIAMFDNLFTFLKSCVYPKLSGIIYLDCPSDVCVKRIAIRGRGEEACLTLDYLDQLDGAFKSVIQESGISCLYLNGVYDLKTDIYKVEQQLTDFIDKKVKEKVIENEIDPAKAK